MLKQIALPRNEFFDPLDDPGQVTGFTSPAQDYVQKRLDLTELLIIDPTNTHFFRAEGDDLVAAYGIADGDVLIVDKSLPRTNGALIVCDDGADFTVKQLPITNPTQTSYYLWGVITCVCQFKTKKKIHVRIGRL